MTHLSLFSGIGGIDLAAHWAGFESIGMVERESFCQKVLANNFPGVPIFNDITEFDAQPFRGRTTLVSAGSPCQGFSSSGLLRGLADERSALIKHTFRVVDECRPSFLLIENTPRIVRIAGEWIADQLKAIGYRICATITLPAYPFGAWFKGERSFIISAPYNWCATLRGDREFQSDEKTCEMWSDFRGGAKESYSGQRRPLESRPYGVADAIPNRVDRLRSLGNAVCPNQAYPILKAIAEASRA